MSARDIFYPLFIHLLQVLCAELRKLLPYWPAPPLFFFYPAAGPWANLKPNYSGPLKFLAGDIKIAAGL